MILVLLAPALTLAACTPGPEPRVSRSPTPAFVGTIAPVTAADLGASWRADCPVGAPDLRLLRLGFWGFDDRAHVGTMIVHRSVAAEVIGVFDRLYRERFPIRRMVPVDRYGASDNASMADDNTSAFNCRPAIGDGPARWSDHAYGTAIDINPVENPYLVGGRVLPPTGVAYTDRSAVRPGMAVPGGLLVEAFASAGWSWGGTWRSSPDYQHFTNPARRDLALGVKHSPAYAPFMATQSPRSRVEEGEVVSSRSPSSSGRSA